MVRNNAGRVLFAGFVASLAMLAVLYLGRALGLPNLDVASMAGRAFGAAQPTNQPWWLGLILLATLGTLLLAPFYASQVHPYVGGGYTGRGVLYGLSLWLITQVVVMPLAGRGFFAARLDVPVPFVLGTLVAFLVYGALLGTICGYDTVEVVPGPPRIVGV